MTVAPPRATSPLPLPARNVAKASNGRSTRINANATPGGILGCRCRAKGQARRPGAYRMVLRGSGRGEEATKKLLAIGPASSTNSHRPQGMRRNSPATKGAARARMQTHLTRNSNINHAPLTCLQDPLLCFQLQALPCRLASCYQASSGCSSCRKRAPVRDTPT